MIMNATILHYSAICCLPLAVGVGLIICKGASLDETRKLTDEDPFQKSGLRTCRIRPWKINEDGIDLKIRFVAGVYEIE